MTRRTFLRGLAAFSVALAADPRRLLEASASPFVPGQWHAVEYRVDGAWASLYVDGRDVTGNVAARAAFGKFVHVDHAAGAIDFGDARGSLRMVLPEEMPPTFTLSFSMNVNPGTLAMDDVALVATGGRA